MGFQGLEIARNGDMAGFFALETTMPFQGDYRPVGPTPVGQGQVQVHAGLDPPLPSHHVRHLDHQLIGVLHQQPKVPFLRAVGQHQAPARHAHPLESHSDGFDILDMG